MGDIFVFAADYICPVVTRRGLDEVGCARKDKPMTERKDAVRSQANMSDHCQRCGKEITGYPYIVNDHAELCWDCWKSWDAAMNKLWVDWFVGGQPRATQEQEGK